MEILQFKRLDFKPQEVASVAWAIASSGCYSRPAVARLLQGVSHNLGEHAAC